MPLVTYFVVQTVLEAKKAGRVVPGDAYEALSAASAEAKVRQIEEGMVKGVVGAIAFSRTGDPDSGDWADAEIIAMGGTVPSELMEAPAW
jgi:hypothetical protein